MIDLILNQYVTDIFIVDFENWAWYRPGEGKMLPEDIDPNLCTHVMYSFATLDPNTLLLKIHDSWADIDNSKSLKLLCNGIRMS